MMLTALALLSLCVSTQAAVHPLTVQDDPQIIFTEDVKVPVVLGVMSRCPDAMLCEAVWDRVLQRVGDKVDISLSFIAKYVHALLLTGARDVNMTKTESIRPRLRGNMHARLRGVRRKCIRVMRRQTSPNFRVVAFPSMPEFSRPGSNRASRDSRELCRNCRV